MAMRNDFASWTASMEGLRVRTPSRLQPQLRHQTPDRASSVLEMSVVDNALNISLAEEANNKAMSPDELIIRSRRMSSPALPVPFLRSPSKHVTSSGMVLRSSPRKRLTMSALNTTLPSLQLDSDEPPTVKRQRLEHDERPLAQRSSDTPLSVLLQGMSQQQLIDLILMGVASEEPQQTAESERRIRALLPLPDVSELEKELIYAKRLLIKSLPASRLQSKTDAVAFGKALPFLNEFKNILTRHAKRLHDSANYDALIDYIVPAWSCVVSTPLWDKDCHNNTRRDCFKLLICYCFAGIKKGGRQLGASRLDWLARSLRSWLKDYHDVQSCLTTLKELLAEPQH